MGSCAKNRNTTIIEIKRGSETSALTEDICKRDAFFSSVYCKAADLLNEICLGMNGDDIGTNNIIMFCGERGEGKTSALMSFTYPLKKLYSNSTDGELASCVNFKFPEMFDELGKRCFFSFLDIIDPSFVDENGSVMRVILSRMFLSLREHWKKVREKGGREYDNGGFGDKTQTDLLKRFKKCYSLLDIIYSRDNEKFKQNDDLYELSALGDSSCLKEEFKELTRLFLSVMDGINNCQDRRRYLVIQLDDTDLSVKNAYQIIEDLRKYCAVPNVVILMAVNMKQLHNVIEQHFVGEYKTLIDVDSKCDMEVKALYPNECRDMAIKYINKVMPVTNRIYLPRIDDCIRDGTVKLTLRYLNEKNEDLIGFKDSSGETITDFQEQLFRLIYNKTGLILVRPQDYVHNFLPQTLRELSHFLLFMIGLPDLEKIGNVKEPIENGQQNLIEKRLDNLKRFEEYFVRNWCAIHLSRDHCRVIGNLTEVSASQKVTTAIGWLKKNFKINSEVELRYPNTYAGLLELQRIILNRELLEDNYSERYCYVYAMRLYFTLFFTSEVLKNLIRSEDYGQTLKNHEKLLGLGNCVFWTRYDPILADLQGSCNFEVDHNLLKKFVPSFDQNGEKNSDSLEIFKKACYININSRNYPLDANNSKVFNALNDAYRSAKITCDIWYTIFNLMSEENDLDLRLSVFNWDVLHGFGKTDILEKDEKHSPQELWGIYYDRLYAYIGGLKYLSLELGDKQGEINNGSYDILFYLDRKTAEDNLKRIKLNLSKIIDEVPLLNRGQNSFDYTSLLNGVTKILQFIRDNRFFLEKVSNGEKWVEDLELVKKYGDDIIDVYSGGKLSESDIDIINFMIMNLESTLQKLKQSLRGDNNEE